MPNNNYLKIKCFFFFHKFISSIGAITRHLRPGEHPAAVALGTPQLSGQFPPSLSSVRLELGRSVAVILWLSFLGVPHDDDDERAERGYNVDLRIVFSSCFFFFCCFGTIFFVLHCRSLEIIYGSVRSLLKNEFDLTNTHQSQNYGHLFTFVYGNM